MKYRNQLFFEDASKCVYVDFERVAAFADLNFGDGTPLATPETDAGTRLTGLEGARSLEVDEAILDSSREFTSPSSHYVGKVGKYRRILRVKAFRKHLRCV